MMSYAKRIRNAADSQQGNQKITINCEHRGSRRMKWKDTQYAAASRFPMGVTPRTPHGNALPCSRTPLFYALMVDASGD